MTYELASATIQDAQVPEHLRGNMAWAAKTELTDSGKPYAVGHVGFSAFELFHLPCVDKQGLYSCLLNGFEKA